MVIVLVYLTVAATPKLAVNSPRSTDHDLDGAFQLAIGGVDDVSPGPWGWLRWFGKGHEMPTPQCQPGLQPQRGIRHAPNAKELRDP